LECFHEGTNQVKARLFEIHRREYENFTQLPGESIDTMFHHFQSIVSKVRSNKPLLAPTYTDHEQALKQLYALDQKVWEVKVSAIIESTNYDTLTLDELFSMLKAAEVDKLSRARLESPSSGRPMALVDSSNVNANPDLSSGFALSSLVSATEEQMEALDDDSLALVIAKF
jgi:hypothetical protein